MKPAADNPNLPRLVTLGGAPAPAAPAKVEETGIDLGALIDLVLKHAFAVPNFTTEWMVERLRLPLPLVGELLEDLRQQRLFDVLGPSGAFGFRYSVAQRGRERAARALEISGYVGPAPLSLAAYAAFLEWQLARHLPRRGFGDGERRRRARHTMSG